jgi:hypothetical protein
MAGCPHPFKIFRRSLNRLPAIFLSSRISAPKHFMKRHTFLAAAAIFPILGLPGGPNPTYSLHLSTGQKIGNIFSRTISVSGEGFTPYAVRVSGTCVYVVKDGNPDKPVFDTRYLYDGRPEGKSTVFYDQGGARVSYKKPDAFAANTDGSGVLYNPLIWGSLPNEIGQGASWDVDIAIPWELGGAGKEKVTVLAADPGHHMMTLQRDGTSDGPFDHDYLDMDISVNGKSTRIHMTPGPARWTGWTSFQDGLVWSDELMVTREVTLTGEGQTFKGQEREYILLNQMP